MRQAKYKSILTPEFLQEEHIIKNKNVFTIAREVGCDSQTIRNYMRIHEVEYRRGYNGSPMTKHGKWSGHGELSLTQFNNNRNNARIRNIPFNVTIEELWDIYIAQNGRCALTGEEIGFVSAKRGNASLDRIDSKCGYEINNVRWVHRDVNFAKQSLSDADFIELCRKVVKIADLNSKA